MSLDIYLSVVQREDIYSTNITHNLTPMAKAAGLYAPLWRPEECGIISAEQLADAIRPGYIELKNNREKYEKFEGTDGWGSYPHFLKFVSALLLKCEEHPEADVTCSR